MRKYMETMESMKYIDGTIATQDNNSKLLGM